MYFKQFKVAGLGCYSYLIGCMELGVGFVVDPERYIDDYIETAIRNGIQITHIFETHLHTDHVSGALELSDRTDAEVYIHPNADVEYPHHSIQEGDVFFFGSVVADVLITPGHTSDSIALVVTDTARSPEPMILLGGDLLLVGDIGRPDPTNGNPSDEMTKDLYQTLYTKLRPFPDWLEVYPAHERTSYFVRNYNNKSMSTLGFERKNNLFLKNLTFPKFCQLLNAEKQLPVTNNQNIAEKNQKGPIAIEDLGHLKKLTLNDVEKLRHDGAVLVDIRKSSEFGAAFIPGSLNIGLTEHSAIWLGTMIDLRCQIIIISNSYHDSLETMVQLRRIGYDNITGCLDSGVTLYADQGKNLDHLAQITISELEEALHKNPEHIVIDVRTVQEIEHGTIKGSMHIPLDELIHHGVDLNKSTQLTVVCDAGYRSNIAGSFLKLQGYPNVSSLIGGMKAWKRYHQD